MTTTYSWTAPFSLIPSPRSYIPPQPEDQFTRVSSEMTCIHNLILRSLNSIYLQSPYIPAKRLPSFLRFCRFWAQNLLDHHRHEEELFFPMIEKEAGEAGCMDVNVEQHRLFEEGLRRFTDFIEGCQRGEEDFSADVLREIIDSFAPAMRNHLAEEIKTLLGLRDRYPKMNLQKCMDIAGDQAVKDMGFTGLMVFFVTNLDITFEDGKHKKFPPIPPPVKVVLAYGAFWKNRDVWDFSCCDAWGRPRELPYTKAP